MMFALLLAIAALGTSLPSPRPSAIRVVSDASFDAIELDPTAPGAPAVVMAWRDRRGERLGTLGAFERAVAADERRLVFAMNGGMYDPDGKPVGLFVQDGEVLAKLVRRAGPGNFGWKPNGVFVVDDAGRGAVMTTEAFDRADSLRARFATQSGPMLLIGGQIHPDFKAGSTHRKVRNGVGVTPAGRIVLAISKGAIGFYEMAAWFAARGCRDALYLDGSVSRALWRAEGLVDTGGDFGVMIGVVE